MRSLYGCGREKGVMKEESRDRWGRKEGKKFLKGKRREILLVAYGGGLPLPRGRESNAS